MASKLIVTVSPFMIKPDAELSNTFGHREFEYIAQSIVSFSQVVGEWTPFTRDQIWRLYTKSHPNDTQYHFNLEFNDFVSCSHIKDLADGYFSVTEAFVLRCFVRDHTLKSLGLEYLSE